MQSLCTLRNHCRQWPRNTRYQADATPYLGRTSTGWIAPALPGARSGICDEHGVVCYRDRVRACLDDLRKHALKLAGCTCLEWLQLQLESVGREHHRLENRRHYRIVWIQEDGDATNGWESLLNQLDSLGTKLWGEE